MGNARSRGRGIRTIYNLEREFIQIGGRPREFNGSLQSLFIAVSGVLSSGVLAHVLVLIRLHIESADTFKPEVKDGRNTGWRSCTDIILTSKD